MIVLHCDVYAVLVAITLVCYSCQSIEDGISDGCYFQGSIYKSGQRIPQEDTCHICLCYRGRVECSWMDCPPPPDSCEEMTLPGECNPTLYVCPIPRQLTDVATVWIRRLKRASDVPPSDLYNEHANGDCRILGVSYNTGDLIGVASHPCLECRCARGELYCSPRCCFSPLNIGEKPSALMKALGRGSRRPEQHPLEYLWKEQDLLWNT